MKRYPCVLQDDAASCGVACLATVAHRYGDRPSWYHLREVTGTGIDGTNLAGLSAAAQTMGYLTWPVAAQPEALGNLPTPFIAHTLREGNGHFVVVHEITGRDVVVADPAEGLARVRRADFLTRWTGKALLLTRKHGLADGLKSEGLLRRLLAMVTPHKWLLAECIAAALLTTLLAYGTALLFSNMVDRVFPSGDVWTLHLFGILALALAFMTGLFTVVNQLLLITIGQRVSVHLMFPTLHRLLELPVSYFDKRQLGDILHRFSNLLGMKALVTRGPVTLTLDVLVILLISTVLFLYNWKLALALLGILPVMCVVTLLSRIPLRRLFSDAYRTAGRLEAQIVSTLGGFSSIRAFGAEELMAQRAEPWIGRLIRLNARLETLSLVPRVANAVLAAAGVALVYWLGGSMVMTGDLSLGQMIFCITLAGSLFPPFQSVLGTVLQIQDSLASFERATDIVDAEPEARPKKGLLPPRGFQGELRVENLGFRYGQETRTIRDVSFRLEPGKIAAIVGESGSGKSTLLRLLNRLYLPETGRILLDGVDLRDVDQASLRRHVSWVDQECRTFAGSIMDNLQIAGSDIPVEDLVGAARLVGLGRFIEKLPGRYDTEVGESGARLSGGERQRLALARGVARRPTLFLLDEPTSHLDPSMERELFTRLKLALKGRTLVFATHRIALARLCDEVLVMKKGEIVEAGPPAELERRKGVFAQFAGRAGETS